MRLPGGEGISRQERLTGFRGAFSGQFRNDRYARSGDFPQRRLAGSAGGGHFIGTPSIRTGDLQILEQFIQLEGVADGVHDRVLQH